MSTKTKTKKINWQKVLYALFIFIPISAYFEFFTEASTAVFILAAIAIIPLAGLMGEATEELVKHSGSGIGGLLNATFGNATEMIIAIFAIKEGLLEVVKASLTGAIVGNILLVMGASILLGGLRHKKQTFNPQAAMTQSLMLILAVIGLLAPTLFSYVSEGPAIENMSLIIAGALIIIYGLGLLFSLRTHSHLFSPVEEEQHRPNWTKGKALAVLLATTIFIAFESEWLVGSVEHAAQAFGMTDLFIGVVIVAIIGNAAEHSTAIVMARKNKMDLSLSIAIGSSTQIALFAAPLLVFISLAFGHAMDLVFIPFEMLAIGISVLIVYVSSSDGESNWFEGVQMLAIYLILGVLFYFLPT